MSEQGQIAYHFIKNTVKTASVTGVTTWLLFHIFPARRAGIILRKAAFAFLEAKVHQPVSAAHGCRAPPSFTGCL